MNMMIENHKDGRATLYREKFPFIIFPNNEGAKNWAVDKYGEVKIEEEEATPGIRFYSPSVQITEKQKFARSKR